MVSLDRALIPAENFKPNHGSALRIKMPENPSCLGKNNMLENNSVSVVFLKRLKASALN